MNLKLSIRISKAIILLYVGSFGILVFLGNTLDYNSNYLFVKHVLSMDTVFPENELKYRAITSETMHRLAYTFIIILEGIFGILCFFAGLMMLIRCKSPIEAFNSAKAVGVIGCLIGLTVWLFGFQVVGGEWFSMWQSKTWNGLGSADRMTTFIFLTLIFITLKKDEIVSTPQSVKVSKNNTIDTADLTKK